MAAYSAYDSYKGSGEDWIENVPAHWETRKLKHLFQEKKHRPNISLNCGSISFGEVVEKDDERVPLATKASYQELSKGEFLVNPLNLNYDLKSLRIGLSDIDVVVSAGYLVLQAKDEMDKRYFKYLLHRYDVAYMKLLGSGVRQTISFNHIANSILVAPPLPEQRAIAAFLDDKCAKINESVKIREDQITLLRERRQIIIQDTVTHGLNPAAPMKDSGEGWIAEIPSHWEIRKLKQLFQEKKHRANMSLNCGAISFGEVVEKDDERTPVATKASYQEVLAGEILVNPLNLNYDLKSLRIALSKINVVVSAGYIVLLAKAEINKDYFKYLLHRYDVAYMKLMGSGVRQTISFNHIANSLLIAPPLPEQRAITAFLDEECAKIDGAVKVKEDQIGLLKEYKTSLINAAVTGKIKVI